MKAASLAGIALLALGIVALTYQGFTYHTQKRVLDVGPIHATRTENHTLSLPPVLGGLAVVGGIVLLVAGTKA